VLLVIAGHSRPKDGVATLAYAGNPSLRIDSFVMDARVVKFTAGPAKGEIRLPAHDELTSSQ
jgi:hypothetical protein